MGATHFLMKTLPRVATEMALHVLAYNLTRVMSIMGIRPLMTAMREQPAPKKADLLEGPQTLRSQTFCLGLDPLELFCRLHINKTGTETVSVIAEGAA
jgi:hypothetical protein